MFGRWRCDSWFYLTKLPYDLQMYFRKTDYPLSPCPLMLQNYPSFHQNIAVPFQQVWKNVLHVIFKYLPTVVKAESTSISAPTWCWSNFLVLPGCTAADRHLYIGPRHTRHSLAVFGGCTRNPSVKKRAGTFADTGPMAVWLFSPKEGEATTVLIVKWDL